MFKTIHALTLLAVTMTGMTAAFAADEYNTAPGLTGAGAPLGLHGVDPVSYIEIGNRLEGTGEYTAIHDGVAYYFASEANLETFEAAPARYVPQFGGFCALGVSVKKKFDGNPKFAAVENGKLYVFLNEGVFNAFQKDRAGTIKTAEANWKKIRHTAATTL